MTVVKNVGCYRGPENVDITFRCCECETNQTIILESDLVGYEAYCKVCNAINELEFIMCPECHSIKYVIERNPYEKLSSPYQCKKCNRIF